MAKNSRSEIRKGIHTRIRKKVSGTTERPRLAVYRSTKHIYAQVIDDVTGKTLVSASSLDKDLKGKDGGNVEGAKKVGKAIAERAINGGIKKVVFDRGGYIYHGRVKALLDATREAGLNKDSDTSDKTESKVEEQKPEKVEVEKTEKKETKSKKAAEEKKVEPKEESVEVEDESADSKEGDDEE